MSNIDKLLEVMRQLRDKDNGCPWDIEQDFRTIAPYTIEEAYEVADAIDKNDLDSLRDELGDLLLQVVFHAQMAAEEGIFAGISSGGALSAALRLSQEIENAVIVTIICDRGDRYLSTNVFPA